MTEPREDVAVVKRLAHLCLGTPDLARVQAFYCGLLGCRVIHEFRNQQGERYGLFLLVNRGTFLEFFLDAESVTHKGVFKHLCFEVEDIHEWAERLKSRGFPVEIRRGRTDGVLQFSIQDPDGNAVEFHQYDSKAIQYPYAAAAA
jgi:lactoylglutathione lyase